jgi:hypothetical protein
MEFSDYLEMPNLEYSESIGKCAHGETHSCDRYPCITKLPFLMTNHIKRHQLLLEISSCETNDLEKYYCKDCDFQADFLIIFNQHIREYHSKNVDCVQEQPKNDIVKSYICQRCSFETYSVLLWLKHLDSSCIDIKKEFEKVHIVTCGDEKWYQCEYCSFETKEATVLKRHQVAEHLPGEEQRFCCSHCKYMAKSKNHLKQHMNYEHAALEAVHWFYCNECPYKSKNYSYLQRHKKNHLPADAVRWYGCDKCDFKTKRRCNVKLHTIAKHLTPDKESHENCSYNTELIDDIIYYKCDYCSFKTKVLLYLERHIQKTHPLRQMVSM